MKPYYEDDHVQLWHGDWRDHLAWHNADVLLTDPPYGIAYNSGSRREFLAASILNDETTAERDAFLLRWQHFGDRPAVVFGTWRAQRPGLTRALLIWDTKGALGMGDLSLPWKPSHQEIYVLGSGFSGRRDSDVITCAPVQSIARERSPAPAREARRAPRSPARQVPRGDGRRPVRRKWLDPRRRQTGGTQGRRDGARRALLRGRRQAPAAGRARLR